MLKQRIITALILAPLTLSCVFFLAADHFAIFCALVILIGAWEWGPLMGLEKPAARGAFVALTGVAMAFLHFLQPAYHMWQGDVLAPLYFNILLVAAIWWLISTALVFSYPGSARWWQGNMLLKGLIGLLTLVPAWVAFIAIRTLNIEVEDKFYFGASLLFGFLAIVWAADIGAYFAGKKLGNAKLMPNVSPNKTVEGFVGGLVSVAVLVLILNWSFSIAGDSYVVYLLIGLITAVISAVGDLNESMLKRSAGIKDSGSILPGHGGLLDRIDSLVAAAPVFILLYSQFA